MYTVAVKRDFVAQHFLIGGDWGAENSPHSHHYVVEFRLYGPQLDQHGFLVDIVDIEHHLDERVSAYRDKMLNDLPEFAGLNPSIEHFSRIFCSQMEERIDAATLSKLEVVLWENEIAWAAFELRLDR
jgi:6-pyruvoyltetrahydropterin/6-carboxytetrahydropterin synthase